MQIPSIPPLANLISISLSVIPNPIDVPMKLIMSNFADIRQQNMDDTFFPRRLFCLWSAFG